MEAERCPRCCRLIDPTGALSQFRSANVAEIRICGRCGELEAVVERYGWEITGPTQWPLGVWDLMFEHMLIYQDAQDAAGWDMTDRDVPNWHAEHVRVRPRRRR